MIIFFQSSTVFTLKVESARKTNDVKYTEPMRKTERVVKYWDRNQEDRTETASSALWGRNPRSYDADWSGVSKVNITVISLYMQAQFNFCFNKLIHSFRHPFVFSRQSRDRGRKEAKCKLVVDCLFDWTLIYYFTFTTFTMNPEKLRIASNLNY